MLKPGYLPHVTVWSCCLLAILALGRPCEAQPFDINEDDVAIANNIPILLLSGPFNGWYLQNNFDFEIATAGGNVVPFKIGPDAPTNSLSIADTTGNVGFGTAGPGASLHIRKQSDPTLRLETVAASQAWDLSVSGATDFQISDATHGTIPVQIESEVPDFTLYLANMAGGHVGIGTPEPDRINNVTLSSAGGRHLNLLAFEGTARAIVQGASAAESYLVQHEGSPGQKIVRSRLATGKYTISSTQDNPAVATEHFFCANLGTLNVGIKTSNPVKPFQVGDLGNTTDGGGAHVTKGGVWTNASSRTLKDDIHPITTEQARETVRALQPVGYRYKNEPDERYVGFIAEDVPEMVATKDRMSLAPMDVVAVLTKVVQDQERRHDQQERTIARLEQTNTEQKQLIDSLAKRLTHLESKSR